MHKYIIAILCCDALSYSFPTEKEKVVDTIKEFKVLSSHGVIDGCVGCLDGLLLRIQTPWTRDTGHVKSYFLGHYQAYGINVQACCDSKCCFTFVCLAAPGGCNDIAAFRKTGLSTLINNLPIGKYVIGDNAYICTEHLLTPFSGEERKEKAKDAYNFYLSQIRMRIEMAFGRLTSKWRILKRPLQVRLKNVGALFLCITRLHNFCINEGEVVTDSSNSENDSEDSSDSQFFPSDVTTTTITGNSMLRDILVNEIQRNSLARPQYNLDRNGKS